MSPSTRLWRYIGKSYEKRFPSSLTPFDVDPRPMPLFWRLCRLLVAVGFLRVETEGGFYVQDGRWTWRFWEPRTLRDHRGGALMVRGWRESLWIYWPGWRWLLTGRREHRRWYR